VPLLDAGVRVSCLLEIVDLLDDDFESRLGDGPVQPLEWSSPSDRIVGNHSDFWSFARFGLDPVRIRDAAICHELIDA